MSRGRDAYEREELKERTSRRAAGASVRRRDREDRTSPLDRLPFTEQTPQPTISTGSVPLRYPAGELRLANEMDSWIAG